MNPYVYSKRRQAALPSTSQPSGAWSFVKEVCNAQIGTALAFAFVLFAAGAVASMSLITYPDLAAAGDVGLQVARIPVKAQSQVLGDSIVAASPVIDDASLEASGPVGKMEIKPVSYNSNGRWNYKIVYSVSGLTGTGSITIGSYVVTSGITASGNIETGAILKPGAVYHVTLWSVDSTGAKVALQTTDLKTPKGKTKPQDCKGDTTLCPQINTMRPPCGKDGNSDSKQGDKPSCGVPPACPTGQTCPTLPTKTPTTLLNPRDGGQGQPPLSGQTPDQAPGGPGPGPGSGSNSNKPAGSQ